MSSIALSRPCPRHSASRWDELGVVTNGRVLPIPSPSASRPQPDSPASAAPSPASCRRNAVNAVVTPRKQDPPTITPASTAPSTASAVPSSNSRNARSSHPSRSTSADPASCSPCPAPVHSPNSPSTIASCCPPATTPAIGPDLLCLRLELRQLRRQLLRQQPAPLQLLQHHNTFGGSPSRLILLRVSFRVLLLLLRHLQLERRQLRLLLLSQRSHSSNTTTRSATALLAAYCFALASLFCCLCFATFGWSSANSAACSSVKDPCPANSSNSATRSAAALNPWRCFAFFATPQPDRLRPLSPGTASRYLPCFSVSVPPPVRPAVLADRSG